MPFLFLFLTDMFLLSCAAWNVHAPTHIRRTAERYSKRAATRLALQVHVPVRSNRNHARSLSSAYGHFDALGRGRGRGEARFSSSSLSFHSNQRQHKHQHKHVGSNSWRLLSTATPAEKLALSEEEEDDSNGGGGEQGKNIKSKASASASANEIQIKSKPIPGGNWKPEDPLGWQTHFGGRDPAKEQELFAKAQLKAGDEGYFDISNINVPGVTMVRTVEQAKIVMERLMAPESQRVFHACDTEVMEIDLKKVGPVGNGYVSCASIYSGPDFDYGLGDGPGTALWIDNLDDSFGVLQEFKEFFEDERFLTVWHNYGFDRHVMWNEGIDVKGFGGDTMHMARLQDTSRGAKYGAGMGYGLEALTADILKRRKKPMKEIFGVARLRKDGTEGSLVDVPPVEVLQRDPRFRVQWIVYSAFDAEGTWLLREELHDMLEDMEWVSITYCCQEVHIAYFYIRSLILISFLG